MACETSSVIRVGSHLTDSNAPARKPVDHFRFAAESGPFRHESRIDVERLQNGNVAQFWPASLRQDLAIARIKTKGAAPRAREPIANMRPN